MIVDADIRIGGGATVDGRREGVGEDWVSEVAELKGNEKDNCRREARQPGTGCVSPAEQQKDGAVHRKLLGRENYRCGVEKKDRDLHPARAMRGRGVVDCRWTSQERRNTLYTLSAQGSLEGESDYDEVCVDESDQTRLEGRRRATDRWSGGQDDEKR